ncbi:MAG: hypothetical protein IIX00_06840, partial [Tidjanibacter sp.]|nr:hypothetical protein [Tidjanibacter sp.]
MCSGSPQIEGVQLSATTCTTELYSSNYTTFEILLQLPQNYYREETSTYGLRGGRGVMMENAYFTNEAMAELFDLVILDDRTVQIVPKIDEDITNPAEVKTKYSSVKSKYEGTIKVSVLGEEYETPKVILNVKKTLPKLKATVPAFNSFYMGQSRNITITGATATEIYADESKNTATKPAMPVWVEFGEELGQLTLKADAPLKSVSGSAYLAVKTEEYRVPVAVTLSVKNTYKTPALKLSASSATMTTLTDASNGAALKLLPTAKNTTLADLNVADITADKGFSVENFNVEDGSFVLRAPEGFASDKVTLTVSFDEEITAVTVKLELRVKTANVALKLAKTSLTLNKNASDYAEVALTATPADFALVDPEIRITGTAMVDGKKQTVDKTDSGELSVGYADGKLY